MLQVRIKTRSHKKKRKQNHFSEPNKVQTKSKQKNNIFSTSRLYHNNTFKRKNFIELKKNVEKANMPISFRLRKKFQHW